jgi:predicted GIY-YIG superfamily endonuclease
MSKQKYWIKEKCQEEVLKYNSFAELKEKNSKVYYIIYENKWCSEVCAHYYLNRKPSNYWTKERCQEEALKYKTCKEFRKFSGSAYTQSIKNKWICDINKHFLKTKHHNNYWTKENCHIESLKYNIKTEFQKKNLAAYSAASKKGWIDEICKHMFLIKTPHKFWNYERCQEAALKCKSRKELAKKYNGAYSSALKHGWLNEMCVHMETTGNRFNRCIYVWEFEDKTTYIGLTFNLKERSYNHTQDINSPVLKYNQKTKLIPICKQLTEYISVEESQIKEDFFIQQYKKLGWNVLNKVKGGSTGRKEKYWTKDRCKGESLKFKSKKEFREKSWVAYQNIYKNKWG